MKNIKKFIPYILMAIIALVCVPSFSHADIHLVLSKGPMLCMALTAADGKFLRSQGYREGNLPNVEILNDGRNVLDYLKNLYPQSPVVSESKLRSEVALVNGASSYTFNIIIGQGTTAQVSTETWLDKNDIFGVTRMGFFLGQRSVVSTSLAAAVSLTTYANPKLAGTGVVVGNLNSFYNASFYIKIGSTVFFETLPTENFKYVPVTQKSSITAASLATYTNAAAGTGTTYTNNTYGPYDDQIDQYCGKFQLSSVLMLSGAASIQIMLNLNAAITGVQTSDTGLTNIGCLYFDGFLVKNAAYRGNA